MATIIAVHGTGASGPEEGSKWWQKGSEFEQAIRELVDLPFGHCPGTVLISNHHGAKLGNDGLRHRDNTLMSLAMEGST